MRENDVVLYDAGRNVSHLPGWRFEEGAARHHLLRHFGVSTLAGFGIEGKPLAVRAAGAILYYLQETQRGAIGQVQRLAFYSLGGFMPCLLYTSDAADEGYSVDLGGRRIIKKKRNERTGRALAVA